MMHVTRTDPPASPQAAPAPEHRYLLHVAIRCWNPLRGQPLLTRFVRSWILTLIA